jgi:hypothetical protein
MGDGEAAAIEDVKFLNSELELYFETTPSKRSNPKILAHDFPLAATLSALGMGRMILVLASA